MFLTVEQAVNWITSQRNQEIGFSSFQRYLNENTNHLNGLNMIHVAGTNGKGSTVAMLASCLMEAGYNVGTFTSPHLYEHEDRIRLNGKQIPAEDFLRIVNTHKEIWEPYHLSMFEMDLDVASIWMKEQNADVVIVEAGLGGRLDSTNVIETPLASVIVSIGLDHMERLGDTEEKIAFEKAGIIKNNGLVICGEKKENCAEVIRNQAEMKQADFFLTETAELLSTNPLRFVYKNHQYEISSLASYQVHNACVAIETLHQCRHKGMLNISDEQIAQGIKKAHWAGRFDVLSSNPLTIVDGAHNAHGIQALKESARQLKRPLTVVFACLKDKDKEEMIRTLNDFADELILTQFDFYRAMPVDHFHSLDALTKVKDWKQAIEMAQSKKEGTVLITGSLYFISEVMTYFKNQKTCDHSADCQSISCCKD